MVEGNPAKSLFTENHDGRLRVILKRENPVKVYGLS